MSDCCVNSPMRLLRGVTRTVTLTIKDASGVPLDLSAVELTVEVIRDGSADKYVPTIAVEGEAHNLIVFTWPADKQKVGLHTIDVRGDFGVTGVSRTNWHGPDGIVIVEWARDTSAREVADLSVEEVSMTGTMETAAAASGGNYYVKPEGGIPASDMTEEVQHSLALADTAYQKPEGGIPASDIAGGVIPDVSDVVRYSSQTKTSEQQAQARTNIGAGTYSKPSGGIPASDIAPGVIPAGVTVDQTYDATSQNAQSGVAMAGALSGKQDTISDLSTIRDGAAEGATAYQKPNTGIPASDLASGVIPDVSNFITTSVDNLVNYYLKDDTYTKAEVQALIGAIQSFHYEIYASTAAVTNPQGNVLYLIGPTGSGEDRYEEYVYDVTKQNPWVKIGDTSIDLSNYVTTSDLNTALSAYTTSADLSDLLDAKQDVIDDLDDIRSGASSGSTALQPTDVNGEDIDLNVSGKIQFANRVYDSQNPDGMGYKILRKNASFASQVTYTNTIYEIRYNFDLGGAEIVAPNNITLLFNGGSIAGGTISGQNLRVSNFVKDSFDYSIFPSGFNIIPGKNGEICNASEIGMIPNDENAAAHNGSVFDALLSANKNLKLDGIYHIGGSHAVQGDVKILDGELYCESYFLKPSAGASVSFDNVYIRGNSGTIIIGFASDNRINYLIDSIVLRNCIFDSGRVVDLRGADVDFSQQEFGINTFIVDGCSFINITNSLFVLINMVISKECRFINNFVDKFIGIVLDCSVTNTYQYAESNKKYKCDFVIDNNEFIGKYYDGGSYYTPLVSESNRVYYRNNIVRNVIAYNTNQYAYDAYVSSEEYYCENNVFINICNLPHGGSPGGTMSEILKSKGGGKLRFAKGNRWNIDFAECRQIAASEGVVFTDEQFATIAKVAIFRFESRIEQLTFIDNVVVVKNGCLSLNSSSKPIVAAKLENNIFDVYDIENTALVPSWSANTTEVIVNGNTFMVRESSGKGFPVDGKLQQDGSNSNDANVLICNNVFNRQFDTCPYAANERIVRDNIVQSIIVSAYVAGRSMRKTNLPSYWDIPMNIPVDREFHIWGINGSFHSKVYLAASVYLGVVFYESCDFSIRYLDVERKVKIRINSTPTSNYIISDENDVVLASGQMSDSASWTNLISVNGTYVRIHRNSSTNIFLQIGAGASSVELDFVAASPGIMSWSSLTTNAYTLGKYKYASTPQWWNGSRWLGADGFAPLSHSGTTTNRPSASAAGAGFIYFDETLGKCVVSNGSAWVNMDGTAL